MTHLPPPQPGQQQPQRAPAWQQQPQQPQQPAAHAWQQPQQGQPQQLAQPSWATAQPATAQAQPQRRGNPFGVVAILVAGAALLVGIAALVSQALIISTGDFDLISGAAIAFSLVRLVVAIVGVAIGVVGLLRRDAPRTLAAIGLGACAALALDVLIGFLNLPITAIVDG